MKKAFAISVVLIMLATLVAACGATPEPQVIKETVVVTQEVEIEVVVTQEVEVEKEVIVTQVVEVEKEVVVTATPPPAEPVTVQFWTAPNPQQEAYWKDVVDRWNAEHPEIQVEWEVIPAGASSEEVLLIGIATGTAPHISTNIFSGFAAQLVGPGAAVALDEEFSDFWDVVEGRQMRNILEKGWGVDGHYYVLPLYNNAMRYWWGQKSLDDAGMAEAPVTYSDVMALCEAIGEPGARYAIGFPSYKNWWDRRDPSLRLLL